MRKSACESLEHFFGLRNMEPANIFQFSASSDLFRFVFGEKSQHQGLRERPGLRTKITNILHLDAALLLDFAKNGFFESLPRFDKTGQGRIHTLRPGGLPPKKTKITGVHQHDGRWISARKNLRSALWIGASHDMSRLFRKSWIAASITEFLLLMPVRHRSGIEEQRALFRGQQPVKLPQRDEPGEAGGE